MPLPALLSRPTVRRGVLAVAVAAGLGVSVVATAASAAPATRAATQPPVFSGARYLALGDSVPFGFREPANLPTPQYTKPHTFTGFPELVGKNLGLRVANAACPGETTGSMISTKRPSNGCENPQPGSANPGYRQAFALKRKYDGTQLGYAISYLNKHPNTRLVSLMIGANDGFYCQETTADHCTSPSELGGVLTTVSKNVTTILSRLRKLGHYNGQIVVVNYYSTNYADPQQSALSKALDQAIDAAAKPFDVRVAPGFLVFKNAAAQASGDTCAAGLLTTLQTGGCGVHPSLAGQHVLASAVARVTTKR